jgi:DNA polymerase-3 subunit beta
MTLTVARAPLAAALAELRRGLSRATTIPVLKTIRLEAANGVLLCQGTDMDVWREIAVPCQGHLPACCPDGERIAAAVSSAAGADVTLAFSNGRLAVRHDAGRGAVACLPADEFPRRPRTEPAATVDVEAADLAALVGRVAHAVSADQVRHCLCGAFLELDAAAGRITLTATDGHRLAHSSCPAAVSGDGAIAVIVPSRALDALAKAGDAVRLSLAERQIEAAWDGNVLCSRLIDGTFPEWRRVVPERDPEPVAVDLGALGEAVGRVAWAADDKHASVWLGVNGSGSYVAARGGSGQEARAALDVSSPQPLAGGFNSRQLGDACGAIGGRAALSLGGGDGRVLRLDPEDRPDDRFVVVGVAMTAIEGGEADA